MAAYMVFTYLKALLPIKPLLGSTNYAFSTKYTVVPFLNMHDLHNISHKKRGWRKTK